VFDLGTNYKQIHAWRQINIQY